MTKVDSIERSITVSSPISKVWEALTLADRLSQWFGDSAEVDLRPGGTMTIGWSEMDATAECVIETVDEPTTFSYRWNSADTGDGQAWNTRVTFTLTEADGQTTVTVVESGLAELPDDVHARTLEENSSGWTHELADLQQHLERADAA